jgi:predicted RNase H-like nuclease
VHFVGVDLAWGDVNPSGVAIVDGVGDLVDIAAAEDDADIAEIVEPHVGGDCLVAIDAPLIVTNPTGQRCCETALNRDFHRFQAGAHPTNTGKREFANIPRGARLAHRLGLDIDPGSHGKRRAIEVYPHPATVALFRLGQTLKYKHKPGRSVDYLKAELSALMQLLEGLENADVPLHLMHHRRWARLRREVHTATRKFQLRRAEDPVDAVVCAYVALYSVRRPDDITLYGDYQTGYIVTPTLPQGLSPARRQTP